MTRFYRHWTTKEEETLRRIWVTETPLKEFLHLFEGRSYSSVSIHANQHMGLGARPTKVRSRYSAVWDSIERLLATGVEMTSKGIADELGFSSRQVKAVLTAKSRGAAKKVHVDSWCRPGKAHFWVEIWAIGDEIDAPRPRSRTRDDLNAVKRQQRATVSRIRKYGVFGTVVDQLYRAAA